MLYRLMCYIDSRMHTMVHGWDCDVPEALEVCLCLDVDFAGDPDTARCWPNSFAPLEFARKAVVRVALHARGSTCGSGPWSAGGTVAFLLSKPPKFTRFEDN